MLTKTLILLILWLVSETANAISYNKCDLDTCGSTLKSFRAHACDDIIGDNRCPLMRGQNVTFEATFMTNVPFKEAMVRTGLVDARSEQFDFYSIEWACWNMGATCPTEANTLVGFNATLVIPEALPSVAQLFRLDLVDVSNDRSIVCVEFEADIK